MLKKRFIVAFVLVLITINSIRAQLTAHFGAVKSKGCAPFTVNFIDSSTGGAVKWNWDFGNGNQSVLQNPSANYITSGLYTISLEVENASGAKNKITRTHFVEVFVNPQSDFSVNKTTVCVGETVEFTELTTQGSAPIDSFTWDFGEGTIKNDRNPTHQFSRAGKYSITLFVIDRNGCEGVERKVQLIEVLERPKAEITASQTSLCSQPFIVHFNSTSTANTNHTWDFGDGGNSNSRNPSYTYNREGVFPVRLIVSATNGCRDTTFLNPAITATVINTGFTAASDTICQQKGLRFNNQTTSSISGLTYLWDFGNGTSSTHTNPEAFYDQTGTYDVKLTSFVPNSTCSDSTTQSVTIHVLPDNVYPLFSDTFSCAPPLTLNYDLSEPVRWVRWRFNNRVQDNSFTKSGSFVYNDFGFYSVRLEYETLSGCITDTTFTNLVTVEKPELAILGVLEECIPYTSQISYFSANPIQIKTIQWFKDDSLISEDPSFSYLFDQPGEGDIRFEIETEEGCFLTQDSTYSFGQKTNPDFTISDSIICIGDTIFYTNTTDSSQVKVHESVWYFFTNEDIEAWDYEMIYDFPGEYSAMLSTRNFGCWDTITKLDLIKVQGPKAGINITRAPCTNDFKIFNSSVYYTSTRWILDGVILDPSPDSLVIDMTGLPPKSIRIWASNDDNECPDDSTTQNIVRFNKLLADFDFEVTGCSPTSVRFSVVNPPGGTNISSDRFFWYVNNAPIPTTGQQEYQHFSSNITLNYENGHVRSYRPTINFHNSGTYSVSLVALRAGCYDTITRIVNIFGPTIQNSFSVSGSCLPIDVNLGATLEEGQSAYWTMGNGSTIFAEDTNTYRYTTSPASGSYVVKYHLVDAGGCVSWQLYNVDVRAPYFNFTAQTETTCPSRFVRFNSIIFNAFGNAPHRFLWDFGDGKTSSLPNPDHEYTEQGIYNVCLRITDRFGCESVVCKEVEFMPGFLEAVITTDTLRIDCPPAIVNFTNQSIHYKNHPIVSYEWEFGDSTFSNLPNPRKTYTLPGRYSVGLTVTDILGCTHRQFIPDLVIIGGPVGDYSFSPAQGCIPHQVTLNAHSDDTTNTFSWDLGDGSTGFGYGINKTYENAGNFTPIVYITNVNGCSYPLPIKGTITAHPLPNVDFTSSFYCLNKPTNFNGIASVNGGTITYNSWLIDNQYFEDHIVSYQFPTPGEKLVMFSAISSNNCRDTIYKTIHIYGFEPEIVAENPQTCLGDEVTLQDRSASPFPITQRTWILNQDSSVNGSSIRFTPESTGWDVQIPRIYLRNTLGCDTLVNFNRIYYVSDTLPFDANNMLHVSVLDDENMQIKFLKSIDTAFESYLVYHYSDSTGYSFNQEVFGLHDTITSTGGLNTLHNVYCYTVTEKNYCGASLPPDSTSLHCSVELSGEADTNVSILRWNPYVGWNEVERYVVYRQRNDGSGAFDSIGWVPGNVHEYYDSLICQTNDYYFRVKAVEKQGYRESSWSDTCLVNPPYFNRVPLPYMVNATVPDNRNTESEWTSPTPSRRPLSHYLLFKSLNDVSYTFIDSIPANTSYYSYYDSIRTNVQTHSYHYRVRAIDECLDTSIISNVSKTILLQSEFTEEFYPKLYWTRYRDWDEGVAYYIIEQLLPEQGFVEIGRTLSGDDTVFHHTDVEKNCNPIYEYRVIAVRNPTDSESIISYSDIRSMSNHTQVPVVSKLYAPNAFSPNADGLNEVLEVKGVYIKQFKMQVYNRWGEKLFESDDCFATWDATFMGREVPSGVYVYTVQAIGADGIKHVVKTDVTLLR